MLSQLGSPPSSSLHALYTVRAPPGRGGGRGWVGGLGGRALNKLTGKDASGVEYT